MFLPLRLIGTKDDDFISSIILDTNQQNPVRTEQLWALRPFMKSLEEYCRTLESDHKILFERRENQYMNQPVEKARIVQPHALLKAASACLLKEPHRAARDYKSLLKDNDRKLFQDDRDVRLYHSIGYLHYRLEFQWRNKRVSPSLKIFRYYIMAGIANRISGGKLILSPKRKFIEDFSAKVLDLCGNEDSFRTEVMLVAEIVVKQAKENDGIENREKLRDEIRRETFAREFFLAL